MSHNKQMTTKLKVVAILLAVCGCSDLGWRSNNSIKPQVASTPQIALQLLIESMRTGDEEAIEKLASKQALSVLNVTGASGTDRIEGLKRSAAYLNKCEVRWTKVDTGAAEALVGPQIKEAGFSFVRLSTGWQLSKVSPGD